MVHVHALSSEQIEPVEPVLFYIETNKLILKEEKK